MRAMEPSHTPTDPAADPASAAFEHASGLPPVLPVLGYAGLLPFWALALGAWVLPAHLSAQLQQLQLAYAAVILSFLGAVHWGLALEQRRSEPLPYVWGVLPSLIGWLAVALPQSAGAPMASVGLIVCWLADRHLMRGWSLARAYGRLRTGLTLLAWGALVIGRLAPGAG
jgi:hypothetical protein